MTLASVTVPIGPTRTWRMPVAPTDYPDRDPCLRADERAAIDVFLHTPQLVGRSAIAAQARGVLARLDGPLRDVAVLLYRDAPPETRADHLRAAQRIVRRAMLARGRVYWGWSAVEWLETIERSLPAQRPHHRDGHGRMILMAAAYLLGKVTDQRGVGQSREMFATATSIFGSAVIEEEFGRLTHALIGQTGLGYSGAPTTLVTLRGAFCSLLLLNRSPYLEDLSVDLLERERVQGSEHRAASIYRIMVALHHLRLIPPPPRRAAVSRRVDRTGLASEWVDWCLAWRERDTRLTPRTRQSIFNAALAAGRWLLDTHPTISSPEQWDEDLALAYVSAVCAETKGTYVSPEGRRHMAPAEFGQPLGPAAIDNRLRALRRFFGDLQDIPHAVGGQRACKITLNFKPAQAFQTPRAVQHLIQPDPRDIELALWYKLVYAAATLTARDLPASASYPLALYRAMALIWVSTGRRSDEIVRLRLACTRADWAPTMLGDDDQPVESESQGAEGALRYLHIPSGKWSGPFWIWIPRYVYDAIEAWKAERPAHQPPLLDAKDREYVDYLFCYRGARVDKPFINRSLIPALFRKAMDDPSVARQDVKDTRGVITSHRGRSQRATILRMLGVPLDDIAAYLGHRNSATVTRYARTHPIQLARTLQRASDDEIIVKGMMDLQAAAEGMNPNRWFLGYEADGAPMYCGHPAWVACPHRLDCPKCSAFIGGERARLLTAGVNATPITATIPMTPVERAAVDGDILLFDALVAQNRDRPPPPAHPDAIFHPEALEVEVSRTGEQPLDRLSLLARQTASLTRALAEAEQMKGRVVLVKSLKSKIALALAEMQGLQEERAEHANDA